MLTPYMNAEFPGIPKYHNAILRVDRSPRHSFHTFFPKLFTITTHP
jgi:hypothetical protein